MNSLEIPLPMYKSFIYFFFLSGLSHNLNKYPNYHHCSTHIFVKSPEKSPENPLPTRPFGPETTCSSSRKTGLQIGHMLGKATDHQLSLASSRKHQLGWQPASFQGQRFPLGRLRMERAWAPIVQSSVQAPCRRTLWAKYASWCGRPDISPWLVLWCPLRQPIAQPSFQISGHLDLCLF